MIAKSSVQPLTQNCFDRFSRTHGLSSGVADTTRLSEPATTSRRSGMGSNTGQRTSSKPLSHFLSPQVLQTTIGRFCFCAFAPFTCCVFSQEDVVDSCDPCHQRPWLLLCDTLENRSVSRPYGFQLDCKGYVYGARRGGVRIIAPDGTLTATIEINI